jgi:biofilm PGA synthesis N-glycosyltransferase PgaC
MLGIVCLIQFAISSLIDRRYEARVGRNYYWMIWYPLAYWLISTATTVVALPKALLKRKGTRAVWVSPDRGVR